MDINFHMIGNTNKITKELKWINQGRQKYILFKIMSQNGHLTPSQIRKKINDISNNEIACYYVSYLLKKFKNRGIITYINNKNKRKFYKLTKLGEEIKNKLSTDLYKIFARAIKNLRQEKNFTQLDMANKANISRRFYQYIENGETEVTLSTVSKIANALGYKPTQLCAKFGEYN